LSCLSAAAAQAVSSPPRATPLASGPSASGSAPIDTSELGADPVPTPSADSLSQPPAAKPASHADGPGGTTVIHESTRQRIAEVSQTTRYDIPRAALVSYRRAVIVMDETAPGCHVSWPVLAAIGQVESDQGRYAGGRVLADGTTDPHIVGIALNGAGNVARIPDTDNGRWDSDPVWDRAVGPMQFIPSTWRVVGVDADGDGVRNPHDFDDAALAAAVYLCANHRDLSTAAGLRAAVYSYNHSDDYVDLVLRLARAYANGEVDVVPNDGPPADDGDGGHHGTPGDHHGHQPGGGGRHHHPGQQPGGQNPPPNPNPGPDPNPNPGPDPNPNPGPDPNPTPEPTPEPPATMPLAGFLAPCEKDATAWCLGDAQLDFGENADLSQPQEDYDADGGTEPVTNELAGLSGVRVTVLVENSDESHVVVEIQGLPYEVIATDPTDPAPTPTDPTPTDPTEPAPTHPTGLPTPAEPDADN
jgi:hypothetical protein